MSARYRRSLPEYEKHALIAVGSIYGVKLLHDNAVTCRDRLFGIVKADTFACCRKGQTPGFLDAIRYVPGRNILTGNALSPRAVGENGADTDEPIIFSEWSIVTGDKAKRRDFRLDEILKGSAEQAQFSLFGSSGTPTSEWEPNEGTGAMAPKPIWECPLTSLYEVRNDD